ncbi:polysaccharide deacetylase family protein [Nonomuraea sp. NPDC050328]|uniref:polysaccharide deacetylase family protein n=1 Tax=Nonomuraea sp. NPDC050328 TaxID=3364361 RepID=UPI00378CC9E6
MHKRRFFGGIALAAAVLTGCGVATASPSQDDTVPADPTKIRFVDPATITGLTTRTLNEGESGGRYVHISHPEFPGAAALNEALAEEARRQQRDFRAATGDTGAAPRPELNVDWQVAAFSDQVIGVRLRTGEFTGANWGNSVRTLWYDRATERATGSLGLLADRDAVRQAVQTKLVDRGVTPTLTDDMLDSIAFSADGDLVVEFDDCQVFDCSQGRVAAAVPKDQARPLLSALGRRAQEAALGQEAATATPRPTTPAPAARAVDCRVAKCVALTFDDGPGPYTGRLLDSLEEAGARATFFTVGLNAAAQPEILRRMVREGHLVANHSWAHRDLSKQSSSRVADSLGRTQDALAAATGVEPTLARPPYGAVNKDVRDVAKRLGVVLVNWNVDTRDWKDRDSKTVTSRAVAGARPGAIILLHDIHRTTVDAVPAILKALKGKGYTLVTVPELYGEATLEAGQLYTSGPLNRATRDGDV